LLNKHYSDEDSLKSGPLSSSSDSSRKQDESENSKKINNDEMDLEFDFLGSENSGKDLNIDFESNKDVLDDQKSNVEPLDESSKIEEDNETQSIVDVPLKPVEKPETSSNKSIELKTPTNEKEEETISNIPEIKMPIIEKTSISSKDLEDGPNESENMIITIEEPKDNIAAEVKSKADVRYLFNIFIEQ
jgi:hypothetical protein